MTDRQELIIDLAEITETYEKGLLDRLRGFGAEESIFETWVPDASTEKSIQNLIDAASEAEFQGVLAIAIPESMISEARLRLLVESMEWSADFASEGGRNWRLQVSGFDGARVDALTSPRSKIRTEKEAAFQGSDVLSRQSTTREERDDFKVSRNTLYDLPTGSDRNRGTLIDKPGAINATSAHGQWKFTLQVDSTSHMVLKAGFLGPEEDSASPLLDKLCDQVAGLPITEVGDHAISRLEFAIRQRRPHPVSGISLPLAVDERFELMQHLVRDAVDAYRQKTGYQETENTFFDRPAASWTALGPSDQRSKITRVLGTKATELGFSENEIEVVDVEFDVRVLVRFSGKMAEIETDKQALMMVLERALGEQLDARLELFLELVKDQSVLRRLGEPGGPGGPGGKEGP